MWKISMKNRILKWNYFYFFNCIRFIWLCLIFILLQNLRLFGCEGEIWGICHWHTYQQNSFCMACIEGCSGYISFFGRRDFILAVTFAKLCTVTLSFCHMYHLTALNIWRFQAQDRFKGYICHYRVILKIFFNNFPIFHHHHIAPKINRCKSHRLLLLKFETNTTTNNFRFQTNQFNKRKSVI